LNQYSWYTMNVFAPHHGGSSDSLLYGIKQITILTDKSVRLVLKSSAE